MTARTRRTDREGPIHKSVLEYLSIALPGAVIHHSPNETDLSGPQAIRMVGKARSLGMRKGWPDIEVLWRGQFLTFEVKAEGNYVTAEQAACGEHIRAHGGEWAVVRSVEDVEQYLREWLSEAPSAVVLPVVGRIS